MLWVPLLVLCTSLVAVELPPEAYIDMQKKAPEFLRIHVRNVSAKQRRMEDATEHSVRVTASVSGVVRSKTGLKKGRTITIRYKVVYHDEPLAGPSLVPIPKVGMKSVAYLAWSRALRAYEPAAGGYTYLTVKP